MRSALCAAAGAALLLGCAHRPPPALHVARLEVDRSNGRFRPFVWARVAGQPLAFLVDTGAFRSVLPAGFARARHLRMGSTAFDEPMIDANGNRTVALLLPDVPVQFEGEASAGTMEFLMNPSPDMEQGVLAPQDLVRPGWAVVFDPAGEELRYEPEEAALARLGGDDSAGRKVDFRGCSLEGLFNRIHRYVATTIDGTRAEMMVDTGADHTVLARNNPALPAMMAKKGERGGVAALTSMGQGLLVDDVAVEFSSARFVVAAVVLPVSDACSGGLLGMDVLRHCTIVWGWRSLWAACRGGERRE